MDVSTAEILLAVGLTLVAFLVAALLLVVLFGVPWQAYRRGHGFLSWFVLQAVALNPIYPMILVAMLPDRAKARLRERFAAELDDLLADARPAVAGPGADAAPDRSIGDLPTAGASVGDLPTAAPGGGAVGRSVGDLPTAE